jgi:predicted acylesterase/phospholipase RssA/CRP-like cAMP-binding protein
MADPSPSLDAQREARAALTSVFGPIGDAAFDAIAGELEFVVTSGGAELFRQGDPGDSVYVLLHGRLHVSQEDEETDEEELLGEVLPGQAVGEIGLLTGATRTATLRAARDSVLVRITAETFNRMCERDPELLRYLTKVVVERLGRRTSRHRFSPQVSNIAVVSTCRDAFTHRLATSLRDALSGFGATRHLEEHEFPIALGEAEEAGDESARARVAEWLAQQEAGQRFVVYEVGRERDVWSRRCLRQADVVVTVVDADAEPGVLRDAPSSRADLATHIRRILVLRHRSPDADLRGTARWLAEADVDEHYHVREGRPEDIARLARILAGRGIGLALGGGGARGFAHIGIYRALTERGVPVDWVGGTSIGSIFAACIAMGWRPDEVQERAREAFLEGKPMSGLTLPMVSVLSPRRLERLVSAVFDRDIEDLTLPFFCIATNLTKAKVVVHERGCLWRALRSSVALPGVFPPAVEGNDLVIDGGILNNLPADVLGDRPVGKVVAASLSVRKEYELEYARIPSPWRILASRLPFVKRMRVPGILILMLKATEVASLVHAGEAQACTDLLLTPPVGRFGLLETTAFDDLVRIGYEHTLEALDTEAGEELVRDLTATE